MNESVEKILRVVPSTSIKIINSDLQKKTKSYITSKYSMRSSYGIPLKPLG